MTLKQIVSRLSANLGELEQAFGVKSLALFGSVARNEATEASDVDLLVDFGKAPSFRQYTNALLYLEDLLGCKVDLVTQDSLKAELIPSVKRNSKTINHA